MIDVAIGEDSIVLQAAITARVERVWTALTERDDIAAWWGPHVSLEPKVGGKLEEQRTNSSGREMVTSGRITRITRPTVLELTWADEDWQRETLVQFDLRTARGATALTLTHGGWASFTEPRRTALMRDHAAGWRAHLAKLTKHVQQAAKTA
jgi:uncharacterized protein YndB with AHSA1/START domain